MVAYALLWCARVKKWICLSPKLYHQVQQFSLIIPITVPWVSSSFLASFSLNLATSALDFSASSFRRWSFCSSMFFSISCTTLYAWFTTSMQFLLTWSSDAYFSASFTMFSILPFEGPPEGWITICCCFPGPLSHAYIFTIPLASISKVTSIWGIPLGAGTHWRPQFFCLKKWICLFFSISCTTLYAWFHHINVVPSN